MPDKATRSSASSGARDNVDRCVSGPIRRHNTARARTAYVVYDNAHGVLSGPGDRRDVDESTVSGDGVARGPSAARLFERHSSVVRTRAPRLRKARNGFELRFRVCVCRSDGQW